MKSTRQRSRRTRAKGSVRPGARHQTARRDPLETFSRHLRDPTGPELIRAAGVPLLAAAMMATSTAGAQATTGSTSSAPVAQSLAELLASVPVPRAIEVTYVVKVGDTVSLIATRTGTSAKAIIAANKLPDNGLIHPGQRLVIPQLAPMATSAPTDPQQSTASVIVRPGDTISSIARQHHVSVASILAANRLSANAVIHPGQRLVVPGAPVKTPAATPKKAAAATPTMSHTVRSGETLSTIAQRYRTSLPELLKLNQLSLTSLIHPGQKIQVPRPATSTNTFLGRTYPAAVVAAADRNRDALSRRNVPTRAQMKTIVADTARARGVDPSLALAVAWQESGFNAAVVSPANAIGTMQVLPSTGRWASTLVGRDLDLLNPHDNALAGVVVLKSLLARADSQEQAIAGYYQGLASVRAHGMYADTRTYVTNVSAHRTKFAAEMV